jgi:ankyrin repeat protein
MAAAIAGHADVVQVLIDHGADLTIPNGDGSSVLEAAIAGRHADTVGLLLEVLGGDDYPQESIALDIAIAKSLTVIKSIMAKEGLFQPDAGVDVTTSQSKYRELIDRILMQGGDLIKPHAMSNMMSTALHEGDLAVVMALLASGCDPNRYLPPGYTTPLQIAISRRSISIVKALLKQGADPTLPTRNAEGPNYTPLHQALITLDSDEYRDTTIIDLLLKTWQCKLMTGENARSTALEYVLSHYSAWDHGLAEIMTFRMLQYTRDIQNDRSDDGATLMHAAVWHGRTDLASILITRRLDINVTDNQGYTPFLLECHRSTRLLRFLLSNGANPHGKDVNNQTALHAAASQGDIGIITFLFRIGLPINVRDQNDYTPFTWALISGQEDTALHLLNLGAKFPHKPLRRGRTMLHIASSLNMSRLTAKILESPSLALLVNARDDMGWSPLALSCRKADPDVVEALIDAGADTQISPHNMLDRPLHLALRAGNVAVAKCLIARGADVNVKGEQGHTALHIAEDVEVVEMLLAHGAKVRVLDNVGRTPLCECEDAGIEQLLITHGANVNHREEDGWTGLHRAVESGDIEMFNVLLKAGGDVGARTRDDGLNVIERIEEVKDRALRVALEEGIAGMRV